MQRRPILFVHGLVITMDGERRILEDGAVAVCQDKIAFVGPSAEALAQYPGAETVDCRGCMILPGLIDAHGHGGHSFTRYVIKETNQWMPAMTHMYQHYVTDEFWYAEGKLQALQRLKNGVTTGVCVLGSQPRCDTPGPAFNNARGYAEVGVRDIVCTGPQHTPWPHNFSRWENGKRIRESVTFDQVCESLEEVIAALNGANGGKTLAYVTPFGLVTSLNPSGPTPRDQVGKLTEHDIRQAKAMRRIADHYHTRIHTDCFGGMIHLASQDPESMLLGPDVHIQHCTALDDQEIEILKRSGASASVAPYWSDAPVEKMLNAGIRVVIGSDGPGDNCDLDMILSARMFALNYRRDAGNRRFLPYEKLLEMITIDKDTKHMKQKLAVDFADLVYNGKWFTPLREALQAFAVKTQEHVTGTVKLKLYKGNIITAGVTSPCSLYSENLVTFEESDYNQNDATGFINLWGLPDTVQALREQGKL